MPKKTVEEQVRFLREVIAPCPTCGKRTLPEHPCPYCGEGAARPEDDEPKEKAPHR